MRSLRARLSEDEIVVAPGVADALSARLCVDVGFDALYVSGAGVSYTLLGRPDVGLVNQQEMATRITALSSAVALPLIVDGDNGHGNALNVIRTVQSFERAGASAIQLEDQVFPKRCGHLAGKRLVSTQEMVGKIKAACHARRSKDFLIIGRTDARSVAGMDEALRRSELYIEAGADILFVEAPMSVEELALVSQTFPDIPLMANMVEGGKTPLVSSSQLQALGYSIVIYPNSLLRSYMYIGRKMLQQLKSAGTTEECLDEMLLFDGLNRLLGGPEIAELEDRFVYKENG